jgi:signal transduction histidine kinase
MDQAKAADHLKSAFLATMSHELRTPLNSIIGFTGIMLQGLAGPLNEEQKKQLGMVQTSSRHLLALINDVLDISKIEAGQLTLSVSTFDLRASVEKTVQLVTPLAEKNGLDLSAEISKDVGMVTSDQRRLEQIILNLLNNAVKFTEKGEIRVTCRAIGAQYELAVSDTGIGIDPTEISHLFQPFHQIDTGLSRKREGTGLGLSICRKLIVLMGGSIDVKSRFGRGSTFTVRFPKFQESDHE